MTESASRVSVYNKQHCAFESLNFSPYTPQTLTSSPPSLPCGVRILPSNVHHNLTQDLVNFIMLVQLPHQVLLILHWENVQRTIKNNSVAIPLRSFCTVFIWTIVWYRQRLKRKQCCLIMNCFPYFSKEALCWQNGWATAVQWWRQL